MSSERSIQHAYVNAIGNAHHFVYMENQFFCSRSPPRQRTSASSATTTTTQERCSSNTDGSNSSSRLTSRCDSHCSSSAAVTEADTLRTNSETAAAAAAAGATATATAVAVTAELSGVSLVSAPVTATPVATVVCVAESGDRDSVVRRQGQSEAVASAVAIDNTTTATTTTAAAAEAATETTKPAAATDVMGQSSRWLLESMPSPPTATTVTADAVKSVDGVAVAVAVAVGDVTDGDDLHVDVGDDIALLQLVASEAAATGTAAAGVAAQSVAAALDDIMENEIALALHKRIVRAIECGELLRVVIVLPVTPAFEKDAARNNQLGVSSWMNTVLKI